MEGTLKISIHNKNDFDLRVVTSNINGTIKLRAQTFENGGPIFNEITSHIAFNVKRFSVT